ncbi:MAG TPA: MFS transporter, partial [Methylococcales bacterium]
LVSFVSLFTDIASEMLYPIMPVYLRSIGFSVLLIGILEGVAEATAGISKGYFGNLSDVLQKRVPFVRGGYTLSAISKPLLAFFTFPLWVFFARTLDRLGKGIRTSARDAILSDETTKEHKGKVFGFHRSMDTVGAAIGPIFALIFLSFYPGQYKWMFIIAFFPGLIAILLTFFLKDKSYSPARQLANSPANDNSPARQLASSPTKAPGFFTYLTYWKTASPVFKKLTIGLLAFALFNSSDAFLLLALKNAGMPDTRMIMFYIFYNLVYAILSYPLGSLADKIGLKTVLIMGLTVFSLVYFFFGFATSIIAFGILFLFYAFYAAATEGISKALITNLADKKDTATAIGFYTSFASIFTLLSSSLSGLLWVLIGPKAMFMISGIGVFGVVVYLLATFTAKME